METVGGAVLSFAVDAEGQKEIPGNQGFYDKHFESEMMHLGGFMKGYPWCMCFAKRCYILGYNDFGYHEGNPIFHDIKEFMTPSARQTLENFKNAEGWVFSKKPKEGALAIWIHYKNGAPTWQGHAGIVKSWNYKRVSTVDGNTNDHGGREGYVVAEKNRRMNFYDTDGLVLQGFIYPKEK